VSPSIRSRSMGKRIADSRGSPAIRSLNSLVARAESSRGSRILPPLIVLSPRMSEPGRVSFRAHPRYSG
jgi:hypothetical protein